MILPNSRRLPSAATLHSFHGRICQNDLVRIGMREKLLFDPGQKYAYSGQGIQVLGRIVEKVSGLQTRPLHPTGDF